MQCRLLPTHKLMHCQVMMHLLQLHTLLSTVTGIAHKLQSVDEQTLQTKDALHKIISRRSVFIL